MQLAERSAQLEIDARWLWQAILTDLQRTLPASAFEWLRNTRLAAFADDAATVEVADQISAETLARRHGKEIERVLAERIGRSVSVSFAPREPATMQIDEIRHSDLQAVCPASVQGVLDGCAQASNSTLSASG